MQDEENKARKLSDKALERVMRDVLNGLMDASQSVSHPGGFSGHSGTALTSLYEYEDSGDTDSI
ncbi:MAG: hypothetical protein ABW101_16620 [Candidatus Thiodiazotropha sp.]